MSIRTHHSGSGPTTPDPRTPAERALADVHAARITLGEGRPGADALALAEYLDRIRATRAALERLAVVCVEDLRTNGRGALEHVPEREITESIFAFSNAVMASAAYLDKEKRYAMLDEISAVKDAFSAYDDALLEVFEA